VAQHSNEHLTTAQLSAFLDKELTPAELALCNAHLQNCQTCQGTLADLRLTSTLVRSLPVVEVPRSFVLPTNLVVLPQEQVHEERATRTSGQTRVHLKQTLRTFSTLAAIVGVLFILVGAFSAIPFHLSNGATSMAPVPASGTTHVAATISTPIKGTRPSSPSVQATLEATSVITPLSTPQGSDQQQYQNPTQPVGPPPVLDLGQPAGRLSLGVVLLLLAVIGYLFTRRR
jgi:predicted anti-sigma-YlaC factor YlaD